MKQVLSSSIVLLPGTDPLDNQYSFKVATKVSSCIIIDLAELLKEYRNDRVEFKKDYKLWNDVYAGEKELEIFRSVLAKSLSENNKIHIINCTLREEIQIIRELYDSLGYFDHKENRFMVPFLTAPVTLGVNIRNLLYSAKDYKSMRERICFIPPAREPGHTKSLFAGLNSGVVSTIGMNSLVLEKSYLNTLLHTEKLNLTTLSQALYGNYLEIGCEIKNWEEWIVLL